jgi:hypothetical protein
MGHVVRANGTQAAGMGFDDARKTNKTTIDSIYPWYHPKNTDF